MAFLIRTIDHTASGREIVRERVVEKDSVSIGRGAENDIHLPDLAVEQQHVSIAEATSGKLEITAVSRLGFAIDGRTENAASIDPTQGAELALGSSRIAISQSNGKVMLTTT